MSNQVQDEDDIVNLTEYVPIRPIVEVEGSQEAEKQAEKQAENRSTYLPIPSLIPSQSDQGLSSIVITSEQSIGNIAPRGG